MNSNTSLFGGKSRKRKAKNGAKGRDRILKEVGAKLHKRFMVICQNDPNKFLVGMTYSPHLFQNFYMGWKFAVNLTPSQHCQLDSVISNMENPLEALDKVVEFGVLHHKIDLNQLGHNVYMKPILVGGTKSSKSSKLQRIAKTQAKLKGLRHPGQEGFNQDLAQVYHKQVHKIKTMDFKCTKERKLEPYQYSAIFLGSPMCQLTKNILVVAPTGSGKTAVIHNLASLYLHDDRVKLFVAPNSEVQRNFYAQIPDHKTLLAKYVKAYPYPSEMLLTFNPKGATPFKIANYKNYLLSVSNLGRTERRKRANKVFGKESYMPHAPIRSITMKKLTQIYEPVDNHDFPEFLERLQRRQPCVKERTKGQTGLNDLVTLRHDYGWDDDARKEVGGMVHNPFNNRVILIDEADRLFEDVDNPKIRMLIYLLKFAVNSVIVALTATPLVEGDETYSSTTSKLLEMIKGWKSPKADPLAKQVQETCSNEGFISYYYDMIPPLYPKTIPHLGSSSGKPVLGRILFSYLRNGNLARYKREVQSQRGRDPQVLVRNKAKYHVYMNYATTKYADKYGGRHDEVARRNVVKDFEQNSNKLMCLFNTMVQEKDLKTAVMFTSGLNAFRTFIQVKHPDMFYDVVQGQAKSQMRIGFLNSKDSDKGRNNDRLLKEFNSSKNLRGENMKVICADRNFLIGIDFRNVRRLILVSPPTDASKYLQTVGRALRMCTYANLPENEQNVRVDIMVATIDPRRSLAQLEDSSRYQDLVDQHVRSTQPILTVDEVALRILLKDVQRYRKHMKTVFETPSMDNTWFTIPNTHQEHDSEELEVVCTSMGVKPREEVHQGNQGNEWNQTFDYQGYSKDRHEEYQVGDPRRELHKMDVVDKKKKHKAIGRKKHAQDARGVGGLGLKPLEPYREKLPDLPKQLPVMNDMDEIKVAESKFRNLAIPSIREAELAKYAKEMRVPNMPVQTFVYETAKELSEVKDTMMEYTNALMLARDNYPKVENFGKGDNFDIEILMAEAAKKWVELAKFYNANFVGGKMREWDRVIGVNLYYLKWKNRVYVQYEPNVRVIRPVLFTNLKAWLQSLGDKTLTNLDFHEIYQSMPEFRSQKDRVRFAAHGKQKKRKVNADGTVDVMVEIRVPELQGQYNEISPVEALRSPEAFRVIVQLYSKILVDHFNIAENQVHGRLDGKSHLLFHVYRVEEDMIDDLDFEEALNQDLLDPDPGQNYLIPMKAMDGNVDDYVLKPRFNVDASNIMKYIRYAVGSNLPKRQVENKTGKFSANRYGGYRDMFKRGTNPYPSSKEILNRNNGNVWIMDGEEGNFKIFDAPTLPTNPTVDPYRSQPKFQEALARRDPFVLLDQIKGEPWQMTVTKPIASIKQFALHTPEEEWRKFWEACLEVKEAYEEKNGKVLYMYTDANPTLAQFHVNFSLNMPKMPKAEPRQKDAPRKEVHVPQHSQDPQDPQDVVQKKKVHFAPQLEKREWKVEEGCARFGDEVYMVVVDVSDPRPVQDFSKVLVMIKDGVYDLVHDKWRKDWTPEESMDAYLKNIAYDTPVLGLRSFSDVEDSVDLSDGKVCVRVLVNFTDVKWDTSRSSEKVKMVSWDEFWKLKPASSVLKVVQVSMKSMIDRYFIRLENM